MVHSLLLVSVLVSSAGADPVWYAHPTAAKSVVQIVRQDIRAFDRAPFAVARDMAPLLGQKSASLRAWVEARLPPLVGDRFFLIPCSKENSEAYPVCGDSSFVPGLGTVIITDVPGISHDLAGARMLQPYSALRSLGVTGGAWLPDNVFYPITASHDAMLALSKDWLVPPTALQPWLSARTFTWIRQAELLGLLRHVDSADFSLATCRIAHKAVVSDCSLQENGPFAVSAHYALAMSRNCLDCTTDERFGLSAYATSYLMRTKGTAMDLLALDRLMDELWRSPAAGDRGKELLEKIKVFRYWRLQQFPGT